MSSAATLRKQLKIKTGSLNRLAKDHKMYKKEAEDQKGVVDKLINEKGEEWYIKNARKMLEESLKMVTKGQTSLAGAVSDLKELVASAKAEPESFKEDDVDLKAANDALANVDAI